MPENIQSAMYEILKRVQTDMASVRTDVAGLKTDVAGLKADVADIRVRVERLEDIAKKQRRDSAAMLVMMRGADGVFDERMKDLEVDMVLMKDRGV